MRTLFGGSAYIYSPAQIDDKFSYTVLLLHCEGNDGGTTFTDDSNAGTHHGTAVGNAHTEKDVKRFGSTSLQCDGTGDYLSFTDDVNWDIGKPEAGYGNEAFTLELFVNITDLTRTENVILGYGDGSGTFSYQLRSYYSGGTGYIEWKWWNGSTYITISDTHANLGVSAATWYHIAISYDESITEFYVDGTRVNTSTEEYQAAAGVDTLHIGGSDSGGSFQGYIDEVRLTIAIPPRYGGATLTVPTRQFPNQGPS